MSHAVTAYERYVRVEVTRLVEATRRLTETIRSGDRASAQRQYARARVYYERIEPVAEIWGRLDLEIDGRMNDFVPQSGFTGFHRVEQILWSATRAPGGISAAVPVMTALDAHLAQLRARTAPARYTLLEMTSGATELLHEIEASKITGEEERYSHLDLVDFRANLDGTTEIVRLLSPALRIHDPQLLATIDQRTQALVQALDQLRARPGYVGSGYVRYSTVGTPRRRSLAALVEALTESVALTTAATSR